MVVAYDRLTEEWKNTCIRLNPEVVIAPQRYGDEYFFHLELRSESRFYRIGYREYVLISLLDGKTSFAHALAVAAQQLGGDAMTEAQATQTIHWLLENGLAFHAEDRSGAVEKKASASGNAWWQKLNPFWMKVPLGKPERLLAAIAPWFGGLFRPVAVFFSIVLMGIALVIVGLYWDAFVLSSQHIWTPSNWLWMLATWVVLKIVHELAHGMACHRFGGEVKETGMIFILLAPMAYVDVTSSWRFSSRWKRIAVAAAGMYVELLIAAVCVIVWSVTDSQVLAHHLFNIILMASLSTVLFNANPLMRFDAYYILSDLMKIPNLYTNGAQAFGQAMGWLFYGQRPHASCCELKHHRWFVTGYGFLAAIWKVTVCIGLTISASLMFGGLGIVLAVFGVISWFGKPVWEMGVGFLERQRVRPHTAVRAVLVGGLLGAMAVGSWYWVPNPFVARIPCIVDFHEASKIRADSAGFVRKVLVHENEEVEAGQPLVQLENRELMAEVAELEALLKQQATRQRIAIDQGDPATAQIERENQSATRKMLREKKKQLERLTVRATTGGRVIGRDLQRWVNTYVKPGEVLLSIGDPDQKEIVLSIADGDVRSTTQLVGESIPVEIGSRRTILAQITRVDPRADTKVVRPRLIAPNGGKVAVQVADRVEGESDESRYEYCEPRFEAVATIDGGTARELFSGERGVAVLESRSASLGQWACRQVQQWWERRR